MSPHDRFDDVLAAWLADGPATADPGTAPGVQARVRATRQRPGWIARQAWRDRGPARPLASVAAVIAVLVIGAMLLAPGSGPTGPATSAPPLGPTAAPSASPVAELLGGHPLTRIAVPAAHSIGVGAGSVWVGTRGTSPAVLRIDPVSLEVTATVDVGGAYSCGQIREAFGAIWSPHCGPGGLKRIDPETDMVTASTPSLGVGIAAFDGSIWDAAATDAGELTRLDPDTGAVEARFRRPDAHGWWSVAALPDSLWAPVGQTLERIDPADGHVLVDIVLDGALWYPYGAHGSIWVADEGGPEVYRIDPVTSTPIATIDLGAYMSGGFAVDDAGQLWGSTQAGLVRIDPATNEVAERVEVLGGGGGYLAAGFGSLWLTSEWRNEVWRIEP